jgi:CAAX prenyl protease-like protein
MALFMLFTMIEGSQPGLALPLYVAKVIIVTAALLLFRAPLRDIRFDSRVLVPAVLVGLLVFVEWIIVDPLTPRIALLGKRSSINPLETIENPTYRALFLAVRFYGLAILVPIMEEVFWRSFLLRWITKPEFEQVPLGSFSTAAFATVALLFGLAHQEWLAAIICAAAYALLLHKTRSLFACVVAHGITNLALGIYILATGSWHYW